MEAGWRGRCAAPFTTARPRAQSGNASKTTWVAHYGKAKKHHSWNARYRWLPIVNIFFIFSLPMAVVALMREFGLVWWSAMLVAVVGAIIPLVDRSDTSY
jgi:hypothetical protein